MKHKLIQTLTNPPPTLSEPPTHLSYGTAGYRAHSTLLSSTLCRASLLAYLRSTNFCGKRLGLMITASHNHRDDNGIKIIDHTGMYIDTNLEAYCDEIVNSDNLRGTLSRINRKMGSHREMGDGPIASVGIGCDTRLSSKDFVRDIVGVLESVGCGVVDYGVVTTPQMHWLVRMGNVRGVKKGEYVEWVCKWYNVIRSSCGNEEFSWVDCASGVGGLMIDQIARRLGKEIRIINPSIDQGNTKCTSDEVLNIDIDDSKKNPLVNIHTHDRKTGESIYVPDPNLLNNCCGADYIITNNRPPKNTVKDTRSVKRCASFDGDADRLIYFSNYNGRFRLMDGDRIAVYLTQTIKRLIDDIQKLSGDQITVGCILSHYSNSAAVNALQNVKVLLADTGVKNFVKLSKTFDVGIFFEPNGHGSVTFSNRIATLLESLHSSNNRSVNILHAMSNLFDPCVGDAVANFLVLEALSDHTTFDSIMDLYENMPTRMLTVKITDKKSVCTAGVEIKEPRELAEKVEVLVKKYGGRAFVRASGTEDVVRVFAECAGRDECDALCVNVAQAVYDICGGVGFHPEIVY